MSRLSRFTCRGVHVEVAHVKSETLSLPEHLDYALCLGFFFPILSFHNDCVKTSDFFYLFSFHEDLVNILLNKSTRKTMISDHLFYQNSAIAILYSVCVSFW